MNRNEFVNITNSNPGECYAFLVENGVKPICFENDRSYDGACNLVREANRFWITVETRDNEKTLQLVHNFFELQSKLT